VPTDGVLTARSGGRGIINTRNHVDQTYSKLSPQGLGVVISGINDNGSLLHCDTRLLSVVEKRSRGYDEVINSLHTPILYLLNGRETNDSPHPAARG
jgi:hypothetical protein